MKNKIGFIGFGNMAKAMAGGILKKGIYEPSDIIASALNKQGLSEVNEKLGIHTTTDNKVAVQADIVVLAVKPQLYQSVINEIRDVVSGEQIIISIAPGKTLGWLLEQFGKPVKIVRTMPNTPALVMEGMTGVCRDKHVSDEDLEKALEVIRCFGKAEVVPEYLMDAVVGVSGSSPAYVFLFIEALADGAVAEGMPRALAYQFAAQAVLGSAKMVLETGTHPGVLKDMVCSPAGTTIAAVKSLEQDGFRGSVINAVQACVDRAKEL